jgi:hypothetical protein
LSPSRTFGVCQSGRVGFVCAPFDVAITPSTRRSARDDDAWLSAIGRKIECNPPMIRQVIDAWICVADACVKPCDLISGAIASSGTVDRIAKEPPYLDVARPRMIQIFLAESQKRRTARVLDAGRVRPDFNHGFHGSHGWEWKRTVRSGALDPWNPWNPWLRSEPSGRTGSGGGGVRETGGWIARQRSVHRRGHNP